MQYWQLQEAKARLSEVVRKTLKEGPQMITVRGEESVVIVSKALFDQFDKPKKTFLEVMRSAPLVDELDLERDKSTARDIDWGWQEK